MLGISSIVLAKISIEASSQKKVKMFVVQKRDSTTLTLNILHNVKPGMGIISDEWQAYNGLPTLPDKSF